jgi:hypothetical protein
MWINSQTDQYLRNAAEVRVAFPGVSFPATLRDSDLDGFTWLFDDPSWVAPPPPPPPPPYVPPVDPGDDPDWQPPEPPPAPPPYVPPPAPQLQGRLIRVAAVAQPAHDPMTQRVDEMPPEQVNGVWTQQLSVVDLPAEEASAKLAQARARARANVERLRDEKAERGGYFAAGHWFKSDPMSRSRHLGLRSLGQVVPGGVTLRSMAGEKVTVTPNLVNDIFSAAMAQDMALFARADELLDQINASSNPEAIDITTGWPATFGGV